MRPALLALLLLTGCAPVGGGWIHLLSVFATFAVVILALAIYDRMRGK